MFGLNLFPLFGIIQNMETIRYQRCKVALRGFNPLQPEAGEMGVVIYQRCRVALRGPTGLLLSRRPSWLLRYTSSRSWLPSCLPKASRQAQRTVSCTCRENTR